MIAVAIAPALFLCPAVSRGPAHSQRCPHSYRQRYRLLPTTPAPLRQQSPRLPLVLYAQAASEAQAPQNSKHKTCACSACLLPLKHRPAANKSSRLDCVKERGISIEGQSLSRKCGNLSFGLLRLFFRVLPIFSQPTSSAPVSLLWGLPI